MIMALIYYSIVLLYPIIAAVILKFTLGNEFFPSVKGAYYLFIGYIITYTSVMLIVLSTVKFIGFALNFSIFTIGFFAIFFIRAYVQTEEHDLFDAISPPKE